MLVKYKFEVGNYHRFINSTLKTMLVKYKLLY